MLSFRSLTTSIGWDASLPLLMNEPNLVSEGNKAMGRCSGRKPDLVWDRATQYPKDMRLKVKFWLESDAGHFLLGPGTLRLLVAVAEQGSLKAGAKAVRLSYRSAWERLRKAEEGLGFPLLERHSGGEGGGGSTLRPQPWS